MTKNGGFTLLEVMVASLILSLTLVGMATVFIAGSRQAQMTSHKTAALYHAREVINMAASFVADDPNPALPAGGFAAPEDDGAGPNGWFEANVRSPVWQRCPSVSAVWGNCYALYDPPAIVGATTHEVDPNSLPADFRNTPVFGNVNYDVETDPPALPAFPAGWKRVTVRVNWTEPQ